MINIENYEFEEFETGTFGVTERRIKIPRDSLRLGQKIYQIDYYYPDGIQEIVVRGVEDYINIEDPKTGEEYTRPIKAGEKPSGYSIILGDGWSTHPYEKYLTKEDAYYAALESHEEFIRDNQSMVDNWQRNINNARQRIEIIKNKIKNKEFK